MSVLEQGMTRFILAAFTVCIASLPFSAAAQEVKPPALTEIMSSAVAAKTAAEATPPAAASVAAATEAPAPASSPALPAALPQATQAPIPPLDPASFPVLAKIKEKSGNVAYDYLGQRFGLDMWVISGPGVMQMIYTLPGNQGAIVGGNLVDSEGKELSSALQQEFIAKNPKRAEEMIAAVQSAVSEQAPPTVADVPAAEISGGTASQKIWAALEKTGWISFGSDVNAPILYAVLDPYQQQSRALWAKLIPMAELNKIRLYVVPVASTKPETVETIARLLGDTDRAGGWRKLIIGEALPPSNGPANPQGVLDMKSNLELMQALRLRSVPVLLYQRHNTGLVRLVTGMPKDWNGFETELMGQSAGTP